MNIAELFVNLGIKGSEKTVGALTNVKKGLSETASMSLEAKAGIVAAMYALERLFATSGAAGTGLTNFNTLLGVSAKTLQQYQYAARQMGVSNQEVEGTFKSLQGAMTKVLLGENAPKGMARLAQMTGGLTPADIDRFAKSPELLMQRLQEYAKKETNAGLRNEVLKSFGVNDNMISAMVRGAFRPDVLRKAPIYSDKEIGALDKANIAWSNLGQKIEMAVGKFNAKHGGQLVKDISMITDSVIKLAEALEKVSEKFKLFEVVAHGLEGIANTLKLVTEIVDKVQGKESKKGDLLYTPPGQEAVPGWKGSPAQKFFQDLFGGSSETTAPAKPYTGPLPWGGADIKTMTTPSRGPAVPAGSNQNININQNLNFQHEGKEHKQTADSVKKANQDAFRQFNQGQVS